MMKKKSIGQAQNGLGFFFAAAEWCSGILGFHLHEALPTSFVFYVYIHFIQVCGTLV